MKGLEIERKFLVDIIKFREMYPDVWYSYIKQGYLETKDGSFIRIRMTNNMMYGEKAFMTIKDEYEKGNTMTRFETEKELDYLLGEVMFDLCNYKIKKERATVKYKQKEWTIDIFEDIDLVMAEIELENEGEEFELPPFIIKEVTSDLKYRNENLAQYGL